MLHKIKFTPIVGMSLITAINTLGIWAINKKINREIKVADRRFESIERGLDATIGNIHGRGLQVDRDINQIKQELNALKK